MRVSKASEERRQEILDAAMRVFYEKGYEKTSISDIALKLGVAQGLIYRYFKSKEALFDGALENYAGRLAEQMGEAIRDGRTTLREKIMSTQSFIHIEDDDSYYYKIFNSPDKKGVYQKLSLKVAERLVPHVTDAITEEMKLGRLTAVEDPETVASFCVYGQLGILFREDISGLQKAERIRKFVAGQRR